MANVIRQDVIEVSVQTDSGGLNKLNSSMDKLKATATGTAGGALSKLTNVFKKMDKSAAQSTTNTDKLESSLKKIGGAANFDNAVEDFERLNKKIKVQESLCENLSNEHKKVASEMGETSNQALKLEANLLNQEDALAKMKRESSSLGSALDDVKSSMDGTSSSAKKSQSSLKAFAKVSLVALGTGLKGILTKLTQIAAKAGGAAFNGLKKMAGVSFKVLSVGLAGVATAIGAIVTKSVSAYADYEQLVGGVDTLFKGSSGTIQQYANDAYKTAGLSANAYMETVTGFSASLIQSLGGDTEKAASYANMAVTDMADNANKMGTSMESITDTYQSLARGNYAMLDNLKLGNTWLMCQMETA